MRSLYFRHIAVSDRWQSQGVLNNASTVFTCSNVLDTATQSQLTQYAIDHFKPDRQNSVRSSVFSSGDLYCFSVEAIRAACAPSPLIRAVFDQLLTPINQCPLPEKLSAPNTQFGYSFFMVVHQLNGNDLEPNLFHRDRLTRATPAKDIDVSFIYRVDDPSNKPGDGLRLKSGETIETVSYTQNGILGFINPNIEHAGALCRSDSKYPNNLRILIMLMKTGLDSSESPHENPDDFFIKVK